MTRRTVFALILATCYCTSPCSIAESPEPHRGFDVIQLEKHGTMVFSSSLIEVRQDGTALFETGDMTGHEIRVGRLPARLLSRLQADVAALDIP